MGTVEDVTLRVTKLRTADGEMYTIPNGQIQSHNLINYTRTGRLRVDFVFNVSYADNASRVKEVLHEILAADGARVSLTCWPRNLE